MILPAQQYVLKCISIELRYNPVLGEWVMVSGIRGRSRDDQPRSTLFCPGNEETGTGWRILVLDDKYPMLVEDPLEPRRHWFYCVVEACLVGSIINKPYRTTGET